MNKNIENVKKGISVFCSDYFFHYLMHHYPYLRLRLCQYLSGNQDIRDTYIIDNDTYSLRKDGKKLIMDIVVEDNFGYYYNFEMQNGYLTHDELVRFQLYAIRLIEKQIINKINNSDLKIVRQLVLYTEKPIQNFDHFYHRIELYDDIYHVLLERGLISLNFIQIKRLEEIGMEATRNDINEFFMLFANEENHKKPQQSELAKGVVNIYNEYINSENFLAYCALERDQRMMDTKLFRAEQEGEISTLQKIIQFKFSVLDIDWLYNCSSKQLDKAVEYVMNCETYEEFKDKTLSVKE